MNNQLALLEEFCNEDYAEGLIKSQFDAVGREINEAYTIPEFKAFITEAISYDIHTMSDLDKAVNDLAQRQNAPSLLNKTCQLLTRIAIIAIGCYGVHKAIVGDGRQALIGLDHAPTMAEKAGKSVEIIHTEMNKWLKYLGFGGIGLGMIWQGCRMVCRFIVQSLIGIDQNKTATLQEKKDLIVGMLNNIDQLLSKETNKDNIEQLNQTKRMLEDKLQDVENIAQHFGWWYK